MAVCKECEHYNACLIHWSESVLRNIGICEHFKSGWISVRDRLPLGMQNVLMYIERKGVMIGYYHPIDELWSYDGWSPVTHWMPLPKAPKEEAE